MCQLRVRDSGSMSATVGACLQQWEHVCNSGSMSATVAECSKPDLSHVITLMLYQSIVTMTKRVVKQMYFSLLEYSILFIHK